MTGAQDDTVTFKYVYIPADHTEAIEERSFSCPQSDDVMAFINMAKQHFRSTAAPRSKAEQSQWEQAFKASLGDKAAGVSDDLINMLAGQQMVEPIPLLTNSPDTGFVAVNMYADDQASIKQLPLNMRATQIAAEVGQALQVSGDVFIARLFDNEEDFRRLDFTAAELSSSAPWIKEAREQLRRRSERSGSTQAALQRLRQQQPAAGGQAPVQQSPSEVAKAKGNEAYKKRDYQTALEHYTAAVKLDQGNVAARNNRAATYLALNMHAEAAADSSAVLEAQPGNVKALMRRAAACEALGRGQEAAADCRRVLELEPKNAEAQQRLDKLLEAAGSGGSSLGEAGQQQQQQQDAATAAAYPPPPPQGEGQ